MNKKEYRKRRNYVYTYVLPFPYKIIYIKMEMNYCKAPFI